MYIYTVNFSWYISPRNAHAAPIPSNAQNAEPQGRIAATSAELPSTRACFRTLPWASMLATLKRLDGLDGMAGRVTEEVGRRKEL